MIRTIPLIPYLLLLFATPSVSAQTTDVPARDLDTLVVTGTRLKDDLSRVPNSTTVIDLATIEARRDASVVKLLRSVPGVQIIQYGGRGG